MSYHGVTTLLLGATGFIGRHVTAALIQRGARVIAAGRSAEVLAGVAADEWISCDVVSANSVTDLIERVRPAITFNLAGYGVDPGERDPVLAQRINSEVPEQLARLLSQLPGARFVHVGSALEYGTAGGDLAESTTCTPTTLYGRTKLAGTLAVQEHGERSGLRALTARLFTVYGPGELDARLLPSLIRAQRSGSRVPLTDGKQRRDFTFVGDVAEGLLRLAESDALPGDIVNLATGKLESVRGFAERAARVIGLAEELMEFGALPTRAEEMSHDPVSVRRLHELTGWTPATSIEEGVRLTIGG